MSEANHKPMNDTEAELSQRELFLLTRGIAIEEATRYYHEESTEEEREGETLEDLIGSLNTHFNQVEALSDADFRRVMRVERMFQNGVMADLLTNLCARIIRLEAQVGALSRKAS